MQQEDFGELFVNELASVHRVACHLCSSPQEAEDLVQETFLHALRSAHTFKLCEFGPRPWLLKILYNVFCRRYGAEKRQVAGLQNLRDGQSIASDVADEQHVDLAQMNWDRVDERLKDAINRLSAAARTTFLLSVVEDLKYREIAEITVVPIGTVMSRLCRARAELSERLGAYALEQGWTRSGAIGPQDADGRRQSEKLTSQAQRAAESPVIE